ncbi:MAG: type II toxin-antitoxin system RelE/ParE family toxin [Hyphomicrobium sp.]|uniref:type II toxin-antitoxin system RelE/ParE family toxin n=1 Tax=Hyphomicrobium sp. TaxID=82 RepID=UPI00132AEA73|nr:type II toxin-antitoxin system RelE/ParE family toxin [Hyphomicrobium sp.]KAB2943478.1 MAG: addiction module toxin RelE [Hyphomicrobium sp.]MBZ0210722.1 type II toxin-antitoxin system RelE/ParE family toxin [Hyphomicrobium sp.]
MSWEVLFHDAFEPEFDQFSQAVQDELLAHARLLEEFGPSLARPNVDTLKGSGHENMKELRFKADDGVWRVAFAFDPRRRAILLVAGDKSGGSEQRYYKRLIKKADERFDSHLELLKKEQQKEKGQ